MIRLTKKNFSGILAVILLAILSGVALAGTNVTIIGTINDKYQIVDDSGTVYDVADNEKGDEIVDLVGKKVKVTGTVMDADGTLIITIASYDVIEE